MGSWAQILPTQAFVFQYWPSSTDLGQVGRTWPNSGPSSANFGQRCSSTGLGSALAEFASFAPCIGAEPVWIMAFAYVCTSSFVGRLRLGHRLVATLLHGSPPAPNLNFRAFVQRVRSCARCRASSGERNSSELEVRTLRRPLLEPQTGDSCLQPLRQRGGGGAREHCECLGRR